MVRTVGFEPATCPLKRCSTTQVTSVSVGISSKNKRWKTAACMKHTRTLGPTKYAVDPTYSLFVRKLADGCLLFSALDSI